MERSLIILLFANRPAMASGAILKLCEDVVGRVARKVVLPPIAALAGEHDFLKFLAKTANEVSYEKPDLSVVPSIRMLLGVFYGSPELYHAAALAYQELLMPPPTPPTQAPQVASSLSELKAAWKKDALQADKGGDAQEFATQHALYKQRLDAAVPTAATTTTTPPSPFASQATQIGAAFFCSKGSESAPFFDIILFADSLGIWKRCNSRKTTGWYLQQVVDFIAESNSLSVCAFAARGCQFKAAKNTVTYKDLLMIAPPARVCVLQSAGNDFDGTSRFRPYDANVEAAVVEAIDLAKAKFSHALGVVGGSEDVWRFVGYRNPGSFNAARNAAVSTCRRTGMAAISGEDSLRDLVLADACGHIQEESVPQMLEAWALWAEMAQKSPMSRAFQGDVQATGDSQTLQAPLLLPSRLRAIIAMYIGQGAKAFAAAKTLPAEVPFCHKLTKNQMPLIMDMSSRTRQTEGHTSRAVLCHACRSWRKTAGFRHHLQHCCGGCVTYENKFTAMCFALAQLRQPEPAWREWALREAIPDYVLVDLQEVRSERHLLPLLQKLQLFSVVCSLH